MVRRAGSPIRGGGGRLGGDVKRVEKKAKQGKPDLKTTERGVCQK